MDIKIQPADPMFNTIAWFIFTLTVGLKWIQIREEELQKPEPNLNALSAIPLSILLYSFIQLSILFLLFFVMETALWFFWRSNEKNAVSGLMQPAIHMASRFAYLFTAVLILSILTQLTVQNLPDPMRLKPALRSRMQRKTAEAILVIQLMVMLIVLVTLLFMDPPATA